MCVCVCEIPAAMKSFKKEVELRQCKPQPDKRTEGRKERKNKRIKEGKIRGRKEGRRSAQKE